MTKPEQNESERPMAFRGADTRYVDTHLATQCIHAGERWERPDVWTPSVPIYNSIVFFYDQVQDLDDMIYGRRTGYGYARWNSPTTSALERALSTLEGAERTLACASGMAAIHLALLAAGARNGATVLASPDLYGPAYNMLKTILPTLGVRTVFADFLDLAQVEEALRTEKPQVVHFEVMTNPLVKVVDAPAVIGLAHRYGAKVIIDNTFTTPFMFRPIVAGADFVCESLSKLLSGHNDLLAGSVSCSAADFETLCDLQVHVGSILSANSAWLALRGLKTFVVRVERQCANAIALAEFLEQHPQVSRVRYPGLRSHAQHATACKIFPEGVFGNMLSFDVRDGNKDRVFRLIDALKIVLPTGSEGDVNSLIVYPARTTHHMLSAEELAALGMNAGTLRLSVGLEDVRDLQADLDQALWVASR